MLKIRQKDIKKNLTFFDPDAETVESQNKSNSDTLTNLREKYKI
jgi:hypothetical protein